jgi:hypothetical protein
MSSMRMTNVMETSERVERKNERYSFNLISEISPSFLSFRTELRF